MSTLARIARSMMSVLSLACSGKVTNPQETRMMERCPGMAAMPGQRSIILVSCGFVTLPEHASDKTDIMDRAIRANVLINALDARGLYTDTPDITRPGTNYQTDMVLQRMERETNRAQSDVMAELAAGTGATLFQNNNDLDAGFARLVSAPEYYYLLAFSPQNRSEERR